MVKSIGEPALEKAPMANTLKSKSRMQYDMTNAESPEAKMDDHGVPASQGRAKRKRGGLVGGTAPRMRLDRARGGKTVGKGTKVNIIVMPQGGSAAPSGSPTPMRAPVQVPPPGPAAPPRPPMQGMPMQGMPMPMGGPPPQGMPPGGPPPMPPGAMGRKDGGKVYPRMKYGAGDGLGRLEKIEKYGSRSKEGEKK